MIKNAIVSVPHSGTRFLCHTVQQLTDQSVSSAMYPVTDSNHIKTKWYKFHLNPPELLRFDGLNSENSKAWLKASENLLIPMRHPKKILTSVQARYLGPLVWGWEGWVENIELALTLSKKSTSHLVIIDTPRKDEVKLLKNFLNRCGFETNSSPIIWETKERWSVGKDKLEQTILPEKAVTLLKDSSIIRDFCYKHNYKL